MPPSACSDQLARLRGAGCGARCRRLRGGAGYDSLWAASTWSCRARGYEPSPMDPDEPDPRPVVALAHLAGYTERIRLARPRDPPAAQPARAREAGGEPRRAHRRPADCSASGWVPRARAARAGRADGGRGARADEYLAAMRSLWEDEAPAYERPPRGVRVAWTPISRPCRGRCAGGPMPDQRSRCSGRGAAVGVAAPGGRARRRGSATLGRPRP